MDSGFQDFSSGKIVTGSGLESEIMPSSDHNSIINQHDRLLESQSDHYQHLRDLPEDEILMYIDKMLMEEDIQDDSIHALQESSDFQDKERSFYEVIGQKYPSSPSPSPQQESTTGLTASQLATLNFWKGVDEATKFLPSITLGFTEGWSVQDPKEGPCKDLSHTNNDKFINRGKKNHHSVEEFDTWTCAGAGCDQVFEAHITDLRNAAASKIGHPKKSNEIKEGDDLRSLLIMCAQSIASNDHPSANELLRQIRPHSSPNGNVNQRVAYYFVLGLEARLAGTGSRTVNAFTWDTISPTDYILAYCTSFISTSFRKILIFASSKLISVRSKKSVRVHIIDLGILYGLQWPVFIRRLTEREGGPPQLRITGIDFPQPECKTAERIAETGSRLAHYAKMFGVPFEYNAIVKSWESIRVEDLKIEEGEFVAVNCLSRAENLQDEMNGVESPRGKVVDLIRKMNPDIFVHAVVSAAYGSPYFNTRFREALFHFSTLFDMLEIVIPRERPERMVLQHILGSEIVNVIACEGPETHKRWQLRHTRAGFKQLSFGRKLVDAIQNKIRNSYHREFVTTEDNKWLSMGWKGRTICAISCWQPVSKFGIDRTYTA